MERRIFGLENEYGVTCTLRGQRRLSPDEVARYLFRRVVSWGRSSNVFLANGARLYLDVGSHPEYATPECDDLVDLVTHDKAGERILEQLLASAEQQEAYYKAFNAPPVNSVAQEAAEEEYLQEVLAAYNKAPFVSQWLDTVLGQNVGNALNVAVVDLLAGKSTPEQMIQSVSDAAKKG